MTVTNIPITQIDPPEPILRRFSETDVQFLELVDQIKAHGGCFQAPPARYRENGRVQLVDGYRRYKAHIHADVPEMSLNIKALNDQEYLAAQMACNALHQDTQWIDYAAHLERLRKMGNTEMTVADLADACKRSVSWVRKILSLNQLQARYADMVRRNEIPVGNAYWLARLPKSEQSKFINDARVLPTREFEEIASKAVRMYRESVKQGKLAVLGVDDFKPMMRDLRIIENELKSPIEVPALIASAGLTNPVEAAMLALQWAFRVDDKSIEERKDKMLFRERQRLNDASRRKADRDRMKESETIT